MSTHQKVRVEQRHFRQAGAQKIDLLCILPQDVPSKMTARRQTQEIELPTEERAEGIFRIMVKEIQNWEPCSKSKSSWDQTGKRQKALGEDFQEDKIVTTPSEFEHTKERPIQMAERLEIYQ